MDESGFRRFLKKFGKKPQVIDGLVHQVSLFETYLAERHSLKLDTAGEKDLEEFVRTLAKDAVREELRGLALYYKFVGNEPLAKSAGIMREQEIAQTRQPFKLREFRGVDPQEIEKLEAIRIITVEHMLTAGCTPAARLQLSERTGIPLQHILELVKLSDLSRLGAIKSVRARLYYQAGLDTPAKFTQWEPEALRQMLVGFVESTGFEGIAPLPKEISNAIAKAKELPDVVQY